MRRPPTRLIAVLALAFAACKPTPPSSGTVTSLSGTAAAAGAGATSGSSTGARTSGSTGAASGTTGGGCGVQSAPCTAPTVPTGICCGQTCSDLHSDPNNCGTCGTQCTPGQQCVLGTCVGTCGANAFACVLPGDGGQLGLCCGSNCVDVNGDPANCGNCGSSCLAQAVCADGQCTQTSCAVDGADEVNCAADGGTGVCCAGACVDMTSDSSACSECGQICPASSSCLQGACLQLDGGLARCSTGPDGGCPAGSVCDATGICTAAACTPSSQNSACERSDAGGLGVCCGSACTDVEVDAVNCGACGNACPSGSLCLAGHCLLTRCGPGADQSECINDAGFGTCCDSVCRSTPSDPANCGFCGVVCDAGMTCSQGTCM